VGTLENIARYPLDAFTFGSYEGLRAGANKVGDALKPPGLPPPTQGPPPAPDLADEELKKAKENEQRRLLQLQGLAKSFNAPSVNATAVPTAQKTLLGQ
jgi:hypothetical protein